jgi:hypothetical protein
VNNDYCVYLEIRQVKQYKQVEVCRDVYLVKGATSKAIHDIIVGILRKNFPEQINPVGHGSPMQNTLRALNGLFGLNCAAGYDPETGESI